MKHLLLLIILLFPLSGKAQIDIQISYNHKNKEVTAKLKNKTNKAFVLGAIVSLDTARYSLIHFILKDKQNRILKKGYEVIYFGGPRIKENGQWEYTSKGRVLSGHAANEYTHKLTDEYYEDENNYTLDVIVQLKAIVLKEKKIHYIDKQQTFLW